MNILIVAATEREVDITRRYLAEKIYQRKDCSIRILITGVGLVNTTYRLTKYFAAEKPDLVIQAGIGGSFHPFYPPGMVTVVKEEIIGDAGAEENKEFMDLFDLQLEEDQFPFTHQLLLNPHQKWLEKSRLQKVRAISVNEITTRHDRILQLTEKYGAIVESMEGAAFHYVCLQEGVPFIQLRSISNYAGERDKLKWKMKDAINNLNEQLLHYIRPLLCH